MIGQIIRATMDECRAFLQSQSGGAGTVILKTDFRAASFPSYTMPMVLVEISGADESMQLLGGLTQMGWQFAFNAYNIMPDPYGNDATGYSTDLLNIPIDSIRQHFSSQGGAGGWLTEGMNDILNAYGFRYTLSGVQPADALDEDGQLMGYRIVFDSMAFDSATLNSSPSTQVLTAVRQVSNG